MGGECRNAHKILARKPEGRGHSEDPDVDGRRILRMLRK
jgi:hypothetical protein